MATLEQIRSQRADDDSAKEFCADLIAEIKALNQIDESPSINIYQAIWTHHKTRASEMTFNTPAGPMTVTVDLINFIVSGDIEVAYCCLKKMNPDDGTLMWHWLTTTRINQWLTRMAEFMGPDVTAALDGVVNA